MKVEKKETKRNEMEKRSEAQKQVSQNINEIAMMTTDNELGEELHLPNGFQWEVLRNLWTEHFEWKYH